MPRCTSSDVRSALPSSAEPPTTSTVMSRSVRRPRLFLARASIGVMVGQSASGARSCASVQSRHAPAAAASDARRDAGRSGGARSCARSTAAERSHASPAGLIVFASDRAKLNDGEIYSLAPGTQARDVTRSLAGEHDLAVAPRGDLIAFWSDRSGFDRVYLAHADGSRRAPRPGDRLRARRRPHQGNGARLQFAAAAVRCSSPCSSIGNATRTTMRSIRAPPAVRPLPPCGFVVAPSPDGTLIACSRSGNGPVSVYDLRAACASGCPCRGPCGRAAAG